MPGRGPAGHRRRGLRRGPDPIGTRAGARGREPVNEHSLPCSRCGQVTRDAVIIYGPDQVGALVAKAAPCRGRCDKNAPDRRDSGARAVTMTASRPGRCAACERDIILGDVLARAPGQSFHYECAPPEDQQLRHRERTRTRQATAAWQVRSLSLRR